MQKTPTFTLSLAVVALAALPACSGMPAGSSGTARSFNQDSLPDAVKVPAGHKVALETVGVGQITYECRPKANAAGAFEWVFVGPQADLNSRSGAKLGTYYGPPATWSASDGSAVTGAQLAVAPAAAGSIPLQLVKANPASGAGAMAGMTYIQRVATMGGSAPTAACEGAVVGRKEVVKYQADYIFWKAA